MKVPVALALYCITALFIACRPAEADAPVKAAQQFYTALSTMDFKKAADFATKDSKTVIELLESLAAMGGQVDLPKETFEKMKAAEFGKAVIDKDVASVPVKIGAESSTILLKKEEGEWKVAFDKENLQELMPENEPAMENSNASPDQN